jgi:N-hydroxyarylamine O-acetyltransferase
VHNQAFTTGTMLPAYLAKVGLAGAALEPDLPTLSELCRRHLLAFPYENLDVQLGRRVTRDPRHAFAKLVEAGRGGWCFEYNGLFAAMLEAAGFQVHRLAGAVMREAAGDAAIGNHLAPVVELGGGLYLADVAMGHFAPVPLAEGPIRHGWRAYSLERLAGGWWRFRNHPGQLPPSFDFSMEVHDPALMDAKCDFLQSDPDSPFVRNAIVQRSWPDRMESLVGPTLTILDAAGEHHLAIGTEAEYAQVVRERLGVSLGDVSSLWRKVSQAPKGGFLAAA